MRSIDRLFAMLERFLAGEYDALKFSHDAPDFLAEHYDEIQAESNKACLYLNDELPDACDIYERGDNPNELMKKIEKIYKTAKRKLER